MRLPSLAATSALLMMTFQTTSAQVTGLTSLHALRDQARPLLIFAPRPEDARLQIQLRTLHEHAAEARERDLIPIALPYNNPSSTPVELSADEAEAARRRFHIAPGDFAVILIGKDGGPKLRAAKPLSMEKLNATIDAMPMRQDEMRAKPSRCSDFAEGRKKESPPKGSDSTLVNEFQGVFRP